MKRRRMWLAPVCLLVLAACDGGSSGTGITVAQGNVASAATALRSAPRAGRERSRLARVLDILRLEGEARARGPFEEIRVTIEGTSLSTESDAQGLFSLRGDFAGPVGMIFQLPDGGPSARLVITVPRGGEVTLTNVHVDAGAGQASADSQRVRFGGLVRDTDCSRQLATMVSRQTPNDGNAYRVDLDAASVRDNAGNGLGCEDLTAGDAVDVDGEVNDDGDIEADSVELDDRSGPSGGGTNGRESGAKSGSNSGEDGGRSGSGEQPTSGGGETSGEGGTSGERETSAERGSGGEGETSGEGGTSGPH